MLPVIKNRGQSPITVKQRQNFSNAPNPPHVQDAYKKLQNLEKIYLYQKPVKKGIIQTYFPYELPCAIPNQKQKIDPKLVETKSQGRLLEPLALKMERNECKPVETAREKDLHKRTYKILNTSQETKLLNKGILSKNISPRVATTANNINNNGNTTKCTIRIRKPRTKKNLHNQIYVGEPSELSPVPNEDNKERMKSTSPAKRRYVRNNVAETQRPHRSSTRDSLHKRNPSAIKDKSKPLATSMNKIKLKPPCAGRRYKNLKADQNMNESQDKHSLTHISSQEKSETMDKEVAKQKLREAISRYAQTSYMFNTHRDLKIEQLLRKKAATKTEGKNTFHQSSIVPYLAKHGIHTDTILFIFNSGDEYMKRAFMERGWIENPLPQSQIFDIRWDLNENLVDYEDLSNGQLCNHFANNQELTTKTGLARNLQKLSNGESFFPRCYDFTDQRQIEEFVKDFHRTGVFNLLKKHAKAFKKVHRAELKEIEAELSKYDGYKSMNKMEWVRRIKNRYKSIYCKVKEEEGISVSTHVFVLEAALAYAKSQLRNRIGDFHNDHEYTKWDQYAKQVKNLEEILCNISIYAFPYNETAKEEISDIIQSTSTSWTYPSLYLEYKVLKILRSLKRVFPQLKLDGDQNIWIMKPSFSSRGNGVHCLRTTKEAFTRGKKMQAKVIQKYIETPFLLQLPGSSGKLERRKFDIRQWVLVTSFNPLEVYMFGTCYLRLCGSEFSLHNFKDKFSHISNYAIQKKNAKVEDVKHDLIMSLPQFLTHLKEVHDIELCWEEEIMPKMKKIINETIQSAAEAIEHKVNSFEVYGFDFVLDDKLSPWLIEVNLSPACCERADWLTQMLGIIAIKTIIDSMARGLIEIIAPRLPDVAGQNVPIPPEDSNRWIKIYDMKEEMKELSYNFTVGNSGLELNGQKTNAKYERKLDRYFMQGKAAAVINKNVRMWLAKCHVSRLRQERSDIQQIIEEEKEC